MAIQSQIEELDKLLSPTQDDKRKIDDMYASLSKRIDEIEDVALANLIITSPLSSTSDAGKYNLVDTIAIINTDISERDLPKKFHEDLNEIADDDTVVHGVKAVYSDTPIHVIPTKYAHQGTIGKRLEGPVYFETLVTTNDMFSSLSRILQHWQFKQGINLETEALVPYEIELILSHIFHENDVEDIKHGVQLFFNYVITSKLSTQLNIHDIHENILLYHDFRIPRKQIYIESVIDANSQLTNNPDQFFKSLL